MLSVAVVQAIVPLLGLYAYMIAMLWLADAKGWEIRTDERRNARHPRKSGRPGCKCTPPRGPGATIQPGPDLGAVTRSRGWITAP